MMPNFSLTLRFFLHYQLVGVPDNAKNNNAKNNKKRAGRRRPRKESSVASDDSTCETSSSDSSACKPRRRGRAQKKKKKSEQQQQEATLSLEEQAQYVALDCEMVGVGVNGKKSIVAKVTLVGWNGETLFDEFIKPDREVTDYRTFVSGIRKADLERAELDIDMCRERVQEIIEDKILIGHALKNDMRVLEIDHPWFMTRDTAKYEPFMQVRFEDGVLWPRKLKELVKEKLNKEIQVVGKPHSAYEDALAALDLYRLVGRKWEKIVEYKIKKTSEILTKKGSLALAQ
jgi:RNA exonuclease 4